MALYSTKKQLFFSCVENLNLINSFIHDESVCTRNKSSEILEKRLFDSFLSKNDQIRFWILNLYQGGSSDNILSSVFEYNSSGIKWKSKGLPLLPFIEYAINEQRYINKYKVDKEPMEHLLDSLNSIRELLKKLKSDNIDIESSLKFSGALETLNYFIDVLNGKYGVEKVPFKLIYHFFKDYWDDLKDSTHTFRALSDLVAMQKGWRDTEESRYFLKCCLNQLEEYMPE
ncbi:hypothetical protein [Holdemanella sp.]|uniref:hypothetical protein n=1 Tax=Holdemanella sp. TaxID=1971762 RepID=UPI003AF1880F